MKKLTNSLMYLLVSGCILQLMHCGLVGPDGGNSSQVGLTGIVYNHDGTRAANAKVIIARWNQSPQVAGVIVDSAVTNDTGGYKIDSLAADTFNLLARSGNQLGYKDSIRVKSDSLTLAPPCTLNAPGSVRGVVRLQPNDNSTNVFILFMGTNTFVRPSDSIGNFTASNLAEGSYKVKIITILPNYTPMDTSFTITAGVDAVLPDTLKLRYSGIPVPQGLRIVYDTLKQIVTLVWNKPTTGSPVSGYNIYRKHQDSALVLLKADWPDTTYSDSTGIQDITYEYRVAVVDTSTTEGVKSTGITVIFASYFIVDTSWGTGGTNHGQFNYPLDISVANNGDIYIVDNGNNRVQVFDSSMQYKMEFGQNILLRPTKIALNSLRESYVAASKNVFVFDSLGSLIDSVPIGNRLFDLDLNNSRIFSITNGDSVNIFTFTGFKISSWTCGQYNSSDWLLVADSTHIFVSDHYENKVKVFDTIGTLITSIDIKLNLSCPGCIAIDNENKRLFVACNRDIYGNRLQVLDASYKLIGDYKIPCMAGEPMAIALLQNGFVYVALGTTNKILRLKSVLP